MVWSWHGPQSSDTLIASSPLNLRLIPMIIIMFRCAARYSAKAAVPGKRSTIGPLRFNCQLHQWWHHRHHNNHHDQVLMQLPSDPKPPVEEPMLPPEGSPTRFATPVHESLKRPSVGRFSAIIFAWNNYFRETYFRKILHLTDVHIDLAYMEGAEAACGFVFPPKTFLSHKHLYFVLHEHRSPQPPYQNSLTSQL